MGISVQLTQFYVFSIVEAPELNLPPLPPRIRTEVVKNKFNRPSSITDPQRDFGIHGEKR